MAEFGNMLGSDEDSNEDMDHIPKTPGPPVVSDRDSDEDKSDGEKDEDMAEDKDEGDKDEDRAEEEEAAKRGKESDSDSDSSSSQSDSSLENNRRKSKSDSEVERSDNEVEDNEENEDTDGNRQKRVTEEVNDANEAHEANDGLSSDENEDNDDKNVNESQEDGSEDEDVIRRVSPKKNKRKFAERSDSSDEDSSEGIHKKSKPEISDNEDNEENDENEDKDKEMDEERDGETEAADKSAKATDIFGEMSSEDEEEDNEKQKDSHKDDGRDSDKESVNENENKDNERRDEESGDEENRNRGNDAVGEQSFIEDEEPPEEPIPETRIEVEIPRIVADLGKEVHFVKLPNFLSIDTHPYDPQWYEDEIDEDENLDDEGRARLKLKVENTIRWRNVVDRETNELKKQSNARAVKWSDGTYSLHLGEEIFDIHKLNLMAGDNNHLFIRQGTGLQGQTVFRTKLTFRPFSTESFTHRKLTLSLADRSQKTQKIRVLPNVGKDPEAHRTEMIKKEEDRLKASIRRENKQRRVRERSLVRGPTASYLEPDGDEDDEEEGISISKIKNQFKRGSFSRYPEEPELSGEESKAAIDDDDSEDELFEKKEQKRKSVQIVESDDE